MSGQEGGDMGLRKVERGAWKGKESTYGIVDDVLVPRVVVDVDRHAPQRGDFGG